MCTNGYERETHTNGDDEPRRVGKSFIREGKTRRGGRKKEKELRQRLITQGCCRLITPFGNTHTHTRAREKEARGHEDRIIILGGGGEVD